MANTTGKKFGGRKKGTPNKSTVKIKTAVMEAFEKCGGAKYLQKVAEEDPKTFFTLLARVLPAEIQADINHSGDIDQTVRIVFGKDGD